MASRKLFQCQLPKCQPLRQGKFMQVTSPEVPPVCPQCKLVGQTGTRWGHLIARLVFIHFDPPSEMPGYGMGYRACDPAKAAYAGTGTDGRPNPWHAVTGVADEVNCPECRETAAWKKAKAEVDGEEVTELATGSAERISGLLRPV